MPLVFTNTNNATSGGIKILVYSIAGAGKTFLLKSYPNASQDLVILSTEKGMLSIQGTNIRVLEIGCYDDLQAAYDWLTNQQNMSTYTGIAIDSLTEIGEQVLAKAKGIYKDQRQAYVDLADKTVELIKKFRDLSGKHVIMTAKIGNIKEDITGAVKYFPVMPGQKLTNALPYLFDEVFYLGLHTDLQSNKTTRYLQTSPDHQVTAKDRSGKLNSYEQADLSLIFNKIINGVTSNG
jgi:hypothetical protein